MTNKEQKRAEELRQTLAPYVEELRELMKAHNAAAVRFSWSGSWWSVYTYTGNGWGDYSGEFHQINTTTNPAQVPELPKRPQVVSFDTYRGAVMRLDIIKRKAEQLKSEADKIATAAGLSGFVPVISSISWGR